MRKLYSFRHPHAKRKQTDCDGESLTQSEFAKELDINYLVEKHVRSGQPFPIANAEQFADVSDAPSFQQAQDSILRAREAWMSIPAKTRRFFGDNIQTFLKALKDPDQVGDLVRMGIVTKKQTPTETAVNQPKADSKVGEASPKVEGAGKAPAQ